MTEQLMDSLLGALNASGIPAYREYPAMQMPTECFFLTAAADICRCGNAVACADGAAAPVTLTLRLRYHCRTDSDFELHCTAADEALYAALLAQDLDIRGAVRDELHYNKTLDRNVCETRIELHGLLMAEQEAEYAAT